MTTRRISQSAISTSSGGGGGTAVRYQPNETPGTVVGELWVDSDSTASVVNANNYITINDASATYALRTPYQSNSPNNINSGQLWVDSDNNTIYIYNGSSWIALSADSGLDDFLLMG